MATIERKDACAVPMPEIRANNLTFNLSAYIGSENGDKSRRNGGNNRNEKDKMFHLKIFGSKRHHYMTLAVPKTESKLIRSLRNPSDRTVEIPNDIFQYAMFYV